MPDPVIDRPTPQPRTKQSQRRLTPAEELEVITAYSSGLTVYQVGSQFHIHRTTVSTIVKRHGLKLRRAPKKKGKGSGKGYEK